MKVIVSDKVKKMIREREEEKMEKWEKDLEEKNILEDIFHGTCKLCESDPELIDSVRWSKEDQKIISGDEPVVIDFTPGIGQRIVVSRKKTLEAAHVYAGRHIAVLNFASALTPGGGGRKAGLTQEECLCRETTLYPCISSKECMEQFYEPHRELEALYNSDMIYTPGVTVLRDHGRIPKIMPESEWFHVDIITMAAPDLKKYKSKKSSDELVDLFEDRFTRMMAEAIKHGVGVLILGAFGCGEFGNDPIVVATGAARALDKFQGAFDFVEFAIYDPSSRKKFHTFRMVLDRYLNKSQAGE